MAVQSFAPPVPCGDLGTHTYQTYENAFNASELDWIIRYGDSLLSDKATIAGRTKEENFAEIRSSKVSWVGKNEQTTWLYDRLSYAAQSLNEQYYRFDLYGFVEDFQYTVYDGAEKGHYGWHVDQSPGDRCPRKFSLTLQLSEPATYTGGDLLFRKADTPDHAPKGRGTIIGFPSYNLHKVTPVTYGIRKSLVVWVAGPPFR